MRSMLPTPIRAMGRHVVFKLKRSNVYEVEQYKSSSFLHIRTIHLKYIYTEVKLNNLPMLMLICVHELLGLIFLRYLKQLIFNILYIRMKAIW
jgi:hypothetical protein